MNSLTNGHGDSQGMLQRLRGRSNKPMQQTALRFQKEGHCIVKLAANISRFASSSWRVVAPLLMGRAVRPQVVRPSNERYQTSRLDPGS